MNIDLRDRVSLVAGDGGPLADATAAALLSAGAQVVDGAGMPEEGGLQLLVNVVADLPTRSFESGALTDIGPVIEQTVTATFQRCQDAGRQMLSGSGGTIINVVAGSPAHGEGSALAAAVRGGIIGMTKVLGTEWARRGIRVVAVTVGRDPGTDEPVAPEQVADVVSYLCSDGASFITGSHVRAGEDAGP